MFAAPWLPNTPTSSTISCKFDVHAVVAEMRAAFSCQYTRTAWCCPSVALQDKILQSMSKGNEVTVTNDGATILKSVYVDNPAAKVLVGTCAWTPRPLLFTALLCVDP
jgi:hypothetical protein